MKIKSYWGQKDKNVLFGVLESTSNNIFYDINKAFVKHWIKIKWNNFKTLRNYITTFDLIVFNEKMTVYRLQFK